MPDIKTNDQPIARTIVYKISIRLFIIIVTSSFISFSYIKNTKTSSEMDFLENYTRLRLESERQLFKEVVNDVSFIRSLIEDAYHSNSKIDKSAINQFNTITFKDRDHAIRTKKEFFNPETDPGIFITKDFLTTDELKNRIIQVYDIFRENHQIWTKHYLTTWAVLNGSVSMTLSPKKPSIVYETVADFSDHNEEYYKITNKENNPDFSGKWTDLYFDPNFKSWMISYTSPIIKNNQKIGSVGVDIYLEEIFSRIINIKLPNSYNFIISQDGSVMAHPEQLTSKQSNPSPSLDLKINDPHISEVFNQIKDKQIKEHQLIKLQQSNVFYSIGKIPETNWFLITVFPKSYLEKNNQFSLFFVLWSSLVYLFIELLILYLTLNKELSRPLIDFISKINQIKNGQKNVEFPIKREDELGVLAKAFMSIQKNLDQRENKIKEYNENLEILVQERTVRLEALLKESKTTLENSIHSAKLATLGEVANGLSHQLNSPIMVLKGSAHQIEKVVKQNNPDIERMKHLLLRLKGTTKKVTESVNNLRVFSRNPANDQMKRTSLSSIFKSALNICSEKFRFHQINISIAPENLEAFNIMAKETQMAHAILNLLNNSFDAIISKKEKWIKINITTDNLTLHIDISDSGAPIPTELTSKIFTPYYTTKIGQNKPGLGLSITQKIIEEHNGTIKYSQKDNHNHFIISLPILNNEIKNEGNNEI